MAVVWVEFVVGGGRGGSIKLKQFALVGGTAIELTKVTGLLLRGSNR